ncbi:14643_t:CDS:2, partial [Dentiscutata erythropus]
QFTQSPEEKKENTFDEAAQGEIDKSHTIKPHNLNETADEEVEKKSLIPQDPHTEIQQVSDTSHREEERSAEQQHQLSTNNNINKNENEPTSPDVTHPRGIEQSEQQLSPNNDNDLNILYLSKLYGSTENTE